MKWRILQFIEGAIFCYLFFTNPIKLKMLWILAVIHFYFPSNHKVWVHNLTKAASMVSSNAIMHSHNNILMLQEPGIHLKIFSCVMWTKLNSINLQDKKKSMMFPNTIPFEEVRWIFQALNAIFETITNACHDKEIFIICLLWKK